MQLLNEYEGTVSPDAIKTAIAYLNEDGVVCLDYYINGTIFETKKFPTHTIDWGLEAARSFGLQ